MSNKAKKVKRKKPKRNQSRKMFASVTLPDGDFQEKFGIEFIQKLFVGIVCKTCNTEWTVKTDDKGNMPKNYWLCPNECNKDIIL